MTIATWTNDRHAAACDAVDRLATATDNELVDALALRIERLATVLTDDEKDGTRYTIGLILSELTKRYV